MSIRAIGFDIDGTLRYSFKDERKGQPIDGAKEVIGEILFRAALQRIKLFVSINQAEQTWAEAYARNGNKEKASKYSKLDEVTKDIASFAKEIGLFIVPWYISVYDERIRDILQKDLADKEMAFDIIHGSIQHNMQWYLQNLPDTKMRQVEVSADPSWRKPEPAMIQRAATKFECQTSEVLYVGDMDSDKQAAQSAGARFFDVRERNLEEIITMLQEGQDATKEA